jgi:hypothetical protein
MNDYTDQRGSERSNCTATIKFSYFNKQPSYEAQILNYSDVGMCFKSEVSLQPDATVYIRLKDAPRQGDFSTDNHGLRSVTLGEVKWCREIQDETKPFYEIGVKYLKVGY